MNKEQFKMLLLAIVAFFCSVWAFLIEDYIMMVLLLLSVIVFCYIAKTKLKDSDMVVNSK